MEIKGKIIHELPLQEGVARSGNQWKKREYVLETQEQFPRKVCFALFGDKVDQYPLAIGEEVTVSVDIESREYNGRWYTNINAWKVEKGTATAAAAPAASAASDPFGDVPPVVNEASGSVAFSADDSGTDDLPF